MDSNEMSDITDTIPGAFRLRDSLVFDIERYKGPWTRWEGIVYHWNETERLYLIAEGTRWCEECDSAANEYNNICWECTAVGPFTRVSHLDRANASFTSVAIAAVRDVGGIIAKGRSHRYGAGISYYTTEGQDRNICPQPHGLKEESLPASPADIRAEAMTKVMSIKRADERDGWHGTRGWKDRLFNKVFEIAQAVSVRIDARRARSLEDANDAQTTSEIGNSKHISVPAGPGRDIGGKADGRNAESLDALPDELRVEVLGSEAVVEERPRKKRRMGI